MRHHRMRHRWHTMKVGCGESSQVSKSYIEDMATKYGADSNVYRVRVLGEFPEESDNAVIPLSLCEAALHRDVEPLVTIMPTWGLDVARYGNCKTALCKRHGNRQIEIKTWSKRDTMEVAGLVLYEYEDTPADLRPAARPAFMAKRLASPPAPISLSAVRHISSSTCSRVGMISTTTSDPPARISSTKAVRKAKVWGRARSITVDA